MDIKKFGLTIDSHKTNVVLFHNITELAKRDPSQYQ